MFDWTSELRAMRGDMDMLTQGLSYLTEAMGNMDKKIDLILEATTAPLPEGNEIADALRDLSAQVAEMREDIREIRDGVLARLPPPRH